MAERKPAYWAVLPASVRYDKSIRPNGKLLYAEIQALADRDGYCFAQNAYFAELYEIAPRTVSDLISQLCDKGYVTVEIVRDPKTNEIQQRRIRVDQPPAEDCDPHAKNGVRGIAKNGVRGIAKNGADNNLDNINNIPPKAPQGGRSRRTVKTAPDWMPERFDKFWTFYRQRVRGEDKQAAIRAWDRLKPDETLIAEMGKALLAQLDSPDWRAGIGIPYASTWLNHRRWEDSLRQAPEGREAEDDGLTVETQEVPVW